MLNFLGKWLKIYRDEIGIFVWSTVLFFLIRSSNIIFNNYAETTFLKRFGVEYLPIVYMINSLSTFVIMGFMAAVMSRLPGSRILAYTLLFCGVSAASLRFVIPLGFDLVYPVLYILKTQYEVLLGLLFWDLANDLFNTRQSKRLFPLITAGGVLGGVIGSFGTPFLAETITLDNLLFAYLGITFLGAVTVYRMGAKYPTLLLPDQKTDKGQSRTSFRKELEKIIPLIRESKLIKILIMLTLMPNVVIPILNFQFNFAVDETYATEQKMLDFFGFFRGALNSISFVILLFIGRVYGRWGLPIALMFHPFNYMIAFLAFLLRFDVVSAMYARISTNVLRTTINNPARAVLVGLFPATYRAVVRPFLRGTVVRVGVLMGSGIILLFQGFYPPRYLSLVAFFFVGAWVISTVILKKSYSEILLDLISRDMLDLRTLEEEDVSHIFMDKKMKARLVHGCLSTEGDECLWYANLLKSVGKEDLDAHILSAIKKQDDRTKIKLLPLLSHNAGQEAAELLSKLLDPAKPDLMVAVARTANRLTSGMPFHFYQQLMETSANPEVKAYAVIGLYRQAPGKYKNIIDSWLESDSLPVRRAGVIAAGESGDVDYIPRLRQMSESEDEGSILPFILRGLHELGAEEMNESALPYLSHSMESVRMAALETYEIANDEDLRRVIALLGDPSDHVHDLAKEKLQTSEYENPLLLVESLALPRRKIREGIFDLLKSLNIRDLDVLRFARTQIEMGYRNLAEADALGHLPESKERDLLKNHLDQRRTARLENVLRVLATQDRSGEMRIIWRGVSSTDPRRRSNSYEALEDLIEPSLSKVMMPLIENLSSREALSVGRKHFQVPNFASSPKALYEHLLSKKDWVTVILTLDLLSKMGPDSIDTNRMEELMGSENKHIRKMAETVMERQKSDAGGSETMEGGFTIPDKILRLKGIQIFEELSVSELAAVASVTEEVVYPEGETVIREGEPGDTMYLIIKGEVKVIKGQEGGQEIELDRIRAGDYFGEMALFEDVSRSATIRTAEESRFLVLRKQEFTEIVREYPQIALHICKVFSQRIRVLHQKIQNVEKTA
jgi:HEAT repeat protein